MSYDDLFAEILFNARNDDFFKMMMGTPNNTFGTNKLYYFKK